MKKPLLIATTNAGKIREFKRLLEVKWDALSPTDLGRAAPDIEEDGSTYFENALKKALGFFRVFGQPVLADDSGLEVDVLKGAPGVHSARFGGVSIGWPERWEALHQALATYPRERWNARFRCVLCYFDGKDEPIFFQGTTEGLIAPEAQGPKGFGYDPIFYALDLGKTFGEATDLEKENVSHRARAVRKLLSSPLPRA